MKSTHNYLDGADFIGGKKETISLAEECGSDSWAVVKVSPRKYALFTGSGISLIPSDEEIVLDHSPLAPENPGPEEIKKLRFKADLSQTAFGELVYKSKVVVAKWESGERRCPPDTWELLNIKILGK